MDFKIGIHKNISMEEYAKIKAVHKSMFSHILKSGKQLKHFLENGEEEKEYMVFGNLVDTLLFEPDCFIDRYITCPETYPTLVKKVETQKPWNWSANYCKEWRESIFAESPDVKIISPEDAERASKIVKSIKTHPEAQRWLSKAEYQLSLCWVDQSTELSCKGRPDAYNGERLIDLKVTSNPLPGFFSNIMYKFKYHAQGAFYHDGFLLAQGKTPDVGPSIPFSFIVAEDKKPFDVVCYDLGLESFEAGRIVYEETLSRYQNFVENDDFPGYSNIVEEIDIPRYALNKIQLEGVIE